MYLARDMLYVSLRILWKKVKLRLLWPQKQADLLLHIWQ